MGRPKSSGYSPQRKTAAMLDRAWQIVSETPYAVTSRFVFYQLYAEGFYNSKADYKNSFTPAISEARKRNYKQWRPDTLEDDTRSAIFDGQGFDTVSQWLTTLTEKVTCRLDLWHSQPYYIELWCEQRGMARQFMHYTSGITIRPMGGQPSIPYKYAAARDLTQSARAYGKTPIVLYFGDLDTGGLTIADTLRQDITEWADTPFDMIWCGITADQVARYGIPDNPEKPGQYQWEALSDQAAGEVIREAVSPFVRHDAIKLVRQREAQATEWLRQRLTEVVTEWDQ